MRCCSKLGKRLRGAALAVDLNRSQKSCRDVDGDVDAVFRQTECVVAPAEVILVMFAPGAVVTSFSVLRNSIEAARQRWPVDFLSPHAVLRAVSAHEDRL